MRNNILLDIMENPFLITSFSSISVWLGISVLAFTAYFLWKRKKLPPGPIGLPIFGYYLFLRKNPLETLNKLAEKYGNIFGIYIGPQYTVFLNDWEAVKDGYGQNSTLARPRFFEKFPYKFGFGGSSGEEWIEVRRLTSKIMKDGLEKNKWEDHVESELSDISELIAQHDGNPIEPKSFFSCSFANNVIALILGDRLETGHSLPKTVSKTVDFLMEHISNFNVSNFSEKLGLFLTMLGLEQMLPFRENTQDFFNFVSNKVDTDVHNFNVEENDSFISRFLVEVDKKKKNKEKTYITEYNLKGTIISLMAGGSETTRSSIIWTLIAMAEQPDKQRKVHEELDRVIGKEGSIRWSQRSKIPYTLATLLEGMRWKPVVPFTTLRIATEDTQIQGYHIPKGTFVMTNTWCLHYDSRYWKHPDQFIPERFLLEDGRKVNMAPDSYNPFSYGKRNCPGKLLALMNMLQYFSVLMQKFIVLPKEGDKVQYEGLLGLSYQAKNAELRFIPR